MTPNEVCWKKLLYCDIIHGYPYYLLPTIVARYVTILQHVYLRFALEINTCCLNLCRESALTEALWRFGESSPHTTNNP